MDYEFEGDKGLLIPLYILFLIAGLLLIYFAYRQFSEARELLLFGKQAKAIVVKFLISKDSDGDDVFTPVFEFSDEKNGLIRVEHDVSSSIWKKGEQVSIIYDPDNPYYFKVISFWNLYQRAIIMTMIACPLIVLSLGYFLFLKQISH